MLVTSRSFAEYAAMFDLPSPLPASILDCCAGGSGFTAVAAERGVDAVALDPAYALSQEALAEHVRQSNSGGTQMVTDNADAFVWEWYGSRARRDELRAEAAEAFLAHLAAHPDRYVAGELPTLPFPDGRFALAVCSHLLFTWANRFSEAWHLDSLRELARVAAEVRVFPLVLQANAAPIPFLASVRETLAAEGIASEIRRVPYEFQRGANEMLVLSRQASQS
jgi:hypothetical protein